jgi:E3 ubiquitin-protein ligase BRE1
MRCIHFLWSLLTGMQLVDEIRILSGEKLPSSLQNGECSDGSRTPEAKWRVTCINVAGPARPVSTALLFEDSDGFSKHLSSRKEKIISSLSGLFARYPPSAPEVSDLQQQLSRLLAAEKEHIVELQRVNTEKDQMSERLDTATHRYMIAEKKIDRIKSAQIQKLEKQATASGPVKEESSPVANGAEATNGIVGGTINEELETARDDAMAEATKRKKQLEQLETENKKLTEEVTSLNVKLAGLSDDDYAKTDLFKALKTQHEDVIKRINNLEATNILLREEAKKYQAEQTAYRIKTDDEMRATISESEGNVARTEADLIRIRQTRDELLAKVNILESSKQDSEASKEQTKELVSACEKRIAALESECERLRLELKPQESTEGQQLADIDGMTQDQLRNKVATLENQYKLLSNELPAMEAAWKKAQAVAGKKIAEITSWEENVSRANADKAKADQKYFAAMKAKEYLDQQLKALRLQGHKSTEIVAQLKEADSLSRSLVEKMEKQCAEMRAQMEDLSNQYRVLQQKLSEGAIASEGQVSQIAELKKMLEAKDTSTLAAKHAQREAETEREKLAVQVEGLEKQCEVLKKKSIGNQSDDETHMRVCLCPFPSFEDGVLTMSPEHAPVPSVQTEFQGHSHQDVRPCLLPVMRPRPTHQSCAQVPYLRQGFWQQRYDESASLSQIHLSRQLSFSDAYVQYDFPFSPFVGIFRPCRRSSGRSPCFWRSSYTRMQWCLGHNACYAKK